MAKSDYYIITANPTIQYKVVFDRMLTPEEAVQAFAHWDFEDILDEETLSFGDKGDISADPVSPEEDDEE